MQGRRLRFLRSVRLFFRSGVTKCSRTRLFIEKVLLLQKGSPHFVPPPTGCDIVALTLPYLLVCDPLKPTTLNNRSRKGRESGRTASARSSKVIAPAASAPARRGAKARLALSPRVARWLTYIVGFLALYAFLTLGYGDVFERAEQESYISTSPDTLYYLLSQPLGHLYWWGRWGLLVFRWAALGGLCLAVVWTLTARLTDYALRVPRRFEGVGFLVAAAQVGWILYCGTHLYYKSEPSRFILVAVALLLLSALAAGVTALVRRHRRPRPCPAGVFPWGLLITLVAVGGCTVVARTVNENEWLTARVQNLAARGEWDEIIDLAQGVRRPSRAVAAYHAIALTETDRLLDGLFDLPYDFPKVRLDSISGNEEYGLFLADCNYHAGLINSAYRSAMDLMVADGPRLATLKRLALCALLSGDKALCRKYLTIIDKVPFEHDFVAWCGRLNDHPKLIDDDPTLHHIRSLAPKEDTFEQNYRQPAFLGYNVGLNQGTDASLITSIAACLYGKDLQSFLPRAQILAQKGKPFPACMQQAIAIMALKQPELLQAFPQVGRFVPDEIRSFLLDANPYVGDRLAVRHQLRDRWLGTYVYYYYTENNDPDQVARPESKERKAGVN